jgi:hypothetical protein
VEALAAAPASEELKALARQLATTANKFGRDLNIASKKQQAHRARRLVLEAVGNAETVLDVSVVAFRCHWRVLSIVLSAS